MTKTKGKVKRVGKSKEKLVCVSCGHEVDGVCDCVIVEHLRKDNLAFCGNCGEWGSHQRFTTVSKWIKARKIMGLSSKINSYD